MSDRVLHFKNKDVIRVSRESSFTYKYSYNYQDGTAFDWSNYTYVVLLKVSPNKATVYKELTHSLTTDSDGVNLGQFTISSVDMSTVRENKLHFYIKAIPTLAGGRTTALLLKQGEIWID